MDIDIQSNQEIIKGRVDGELVIQISFLKMGEHKEGWIPTLLKIVPQHDKPKALAYIKCIREGLDELENRLKEK